MNTNASQMSQMKVYAVIGGIDYEGEDFASLKLFDCKSSAEVYYQQLSEDQGFDYALMEEREVYMESAIAA